jgi:malonyl-CoA O-methyltransferase
VNVPTDQDFQLDPQEVRRSFDRASVHYDAAAVLQKEIRMRLLQRLDLVKLDTGMIIDLGAGTGHACKALQQKFPDSQVIALDIAEGMLRVARDRGNNRALLCADANRIPLPDNSVELVFCNLMLQWCNNLDDIFHEVRRVLRPQGLFSFTTFGPDTLRELREAWTVVDDYSHVNRFIDMHNIGDALVRIGLLEPVMDAEYFTLTYERVIDLMRDLKAIGAHNVTDGRARGLTGRNRLVKLEAGYEKYRSDARLPATYEVVFGQAWAPTPGQGVSMQDGEARVSLRDIALRRP